MAVVHLVPALILVAVGTSILMRRDKLTQQERAWCQVLAGRAGWTVAGGLLAIAGLLQLVAAVA